MAAFWGAARLYPQRESLALHTLKLAGFATYLPRLREQKVRYGRPVEVTPPLFPGYCFVSLSEQRWWNARWAPGVLGLIMNGMIPARIPDAVVAEIRGRERGGFVVLPRAPGLRPGSKVRVVSGAFSGQMAIYAGMSARQRVDVLLTLLGSLRRVTLARRDVEPVI
jgi:transcriptional antiterminator RfaH